MTTIKKKCWVFIMSDLPEIYGRIDGIAVTEVYLNKPKNRRNPFDYSVNPKRNWKAIEATLTYTLPTPKHKKR